MPSAPIYQMVVLYSKWKDRQHGPCRQCKDVPADMAGQKYRTDHAHQPLSFFSDVKASSHSVDNWKVAFFFAKGCNGAAIVAKPGTN